MENRMTMSTVEEAGEQRSSLDALQLAGASVLPMALKTAVELGVLDIIHRAGPGAELSASQIVSKLDSKNPRAAYLLDHMLCLLATHSVLTCSVSPAHQSDGSQSQSCQRVYGLAPVSKYFIKDEQGGSLSPLLHLIQHRVVLDMWFHWKDAILEGGLPFEKAHGMSTMSYIHKDARFGENFWETMNDLNKLFVVQMLEAYKGFEGLRSLVDVGGRDGSVLKMIISKYPSIKGVNFDLPSVIEKAPSIEGVENVGGDMIQGVPKGEAILIKWVLHSWTDEECVKVFKNCHESLPENGKVMVVDFVIPEAPDASLAVQSVFQLCMFMLSMNPNRNERTEKDFDSLAKAAGFAGVRVFPCGYGFSLIEIYKN
ncbi:caffeic acid 3-O-methyltransferase 1-like [Punica granatum]|uniref:Uncharacterized protein n=2 Tax=Punica granatum TaxID=22663 RepID=A0A2I0JDY9_PUNGR|nr:caffeic acid 3-O-methyltransferase 1-like [Punica granatum]PKI54447.1 hypothetical protein CRG98_025130 [Punica granatum]